MDQVNVAEARDQLADLLNRAAYAKERIVIVRHNKRVAALVPIEDIQALEALDDKGKNIKPVRGQPRARTELVKEKFAPSRKSPEKVTGRKKSAKRR